MEFNQESEEKNSNEDQSDQSKAKQWLQDNMRIIISILIVVLIAGGIYSYSKRTDQQLAMEEEAQEESIFSENGEVLLDEEEGEEGEEVALGEGEEPAVQEEQKTPETKQPAQEKTPEVKPAQPEISSASTSQETETSFIETAVAGDSQTKLARRALADFLEKNPDSALTAEHKIYIEDFLRKSVNFKGRVFVGTSVEFSKDLIKNAIERSKSLNEGQINNLHKYVVRVPTLS